MWAVEFQAKVVDGRIEIPESVRDRFRGEVSVILFADGAGRDQTKWPAQDRRRWELIAKKARQGLSDVEMDELNSLQQQADEQLARVGPRPVEELERLYAELSHAK